ncbi:hypothetical protein RFF05_11445 [Bengtsoniella intestinalis]|uniref:hypothetical protein n=1 Tax=Bengtsoniella intestinalis TaxID=3073143 RepID=UPI00391F35E0
MLVTFCGHSRVAHAKEVETWLTEVVGDLINEGATHFYLGGYGDFDSMAFKVVRSFKKTHPNIETTYVKAYLDRDPWNVDWYDGTTYPPIEIGPARFAIVRRNRWLAETADVVVSYLRYEDSGGAAAMWKHAKRHNKRIIRCPFAT